MNFAPNLHESSQLTEVGDMTARVQRILALGDVRLVDVRTS